MTLLEHLMRAESMELLGTGALGRRELERQLSGEPSRTDVVLHLARLEAAELVRRSGNRYQVAKPG